MLIRKFDFMRTTAILAAFIAILGLSLSAAKAHRYHAHFDPGAVIAGAVLGAIISHGFHRHHHKKYHKRSKRRYHRARKIRRCSRHRCGRVQRHHRQHRRLFWEH